MARNLNIEHKEKSGFEGRVADAITRVAGSLNFVYAHLFLFGFWIVVNLGLVGFLASFDPYPFGLLTMVVSLEAIFLATFVLISQNRQAKREELRAHLDYETDLKSEEDILYIKALVEKIAKELKIEVKNDKLNKE